MVINFSNFINFTIFTDSTINFTNTFTYINFTNTITNINCTINSITNSTNSTIKCSTTRCIFKTINLIVTIGFFCKFVN